MMNTLHDLWLDAEPRLSTYAGDARHRELMREIAELSRQFYADLPADKVALLDSLNVKECDLVRLEKEDVFCYGIRLGAGFILDLLFPPSAFRPSAESPQ